MSAEERGDVLIDERELFQVLRGLRPEREAFRAAVERRVREAPASALDGARPLGTADGAWWRRAAAWLPGEIVPGSLAVGSKSSWKALPGLVALPALSFAMLALPVVFALGTFGADSGEHARERLEAVRSWWREHRRAALVSLALVGLLFLLEPASAGVALLLVSTGVLALLLARLRAAGFGQRALVGRHCASLLFSLALWMAMFDEPWLALVPSVRGAKLAFLTLVLGGVTCAAVSLRTSYPSFWKLVTRARTAEAVLLLELALFVPWSLVVGWSALRPAPGLAAQARHLAAVRPERLEEWEQARKTTAWLRHEGVDPELGALRSHWRAARDAGAAATPGFLAAGVDLGFLDPDELAAEAAEVLRADGPLTGASLRERADLLALVRAGSLSAAERAHLAGRLVASRDAGAQPWVLERIYTVAELLDGLDQGTLADELRPAALALLRESWMPSRGPLGSPAGFFARRWKESEHPFLPHTHHAVDLMLRFGVPPEIDLPALAAALEKGARPEPPWRERGMLEWEAVLALSKVERGLLPERSWLGHLRANRVGLAMLVLASFCVAATLRAPRGLPTRNGGTEGTVRAS